MIDWTAVGSSLAGLAIGAAGTIAWWQSRAARAARVDAEVAESGKVRSIADAEHTLYKLLAERLASVEAEVQSLRGDLSVERKHSRQLEVHIYRLENVMRKAGLEPPEREFIVG